MSHNFLQKKNIYRENVGSIKLYLLNNWEGKVERVLKHAKECKKLARGQQDEGDQNLEIEGGGTEEGGRGRE